MADATVSSKRYSLPQATIAETVGFVGGVVLPVLARGVIIRRPRVVGLAERLDVDSKAVQRVQRLRAKYGSGPLLMKVPFRRQALILDSEHVHQVLDGTPEIFSTASMEKQAALSHFQPKGALISTGPERADRRRFNEQVLDSGDDFHRLTERFSTIVTEEAAALLASPNGTSELAWDQFFEGWMRVVRRIVLGDGAADDHELTRMIADLRSDANWAFARPKRKRLRHAFFQRLNKHLERAEPGSLAAVIAATPATSMTHPEQQVPQWLFAFDPAGMATFRALALLASHPDVASRARSEVVAAGTSGRPDYPLLRATVLEALRLWPTTPMVLRETTAPTIWENGVLPEHTNVMVFAPFFHRDDQHLEDAHRFAPGIWEQERTSSDWPLIPFSGGPAICPGRNLVLLTASSMLANMLERYDLHLASHPGLSPGKKLPGTLNNYGLRFTLQPH